MRVELHPQAEQELEEALGWLDDISTALSTEFAVLVEDTLALLAARPGIGAPVQHPSEAVGLRRHPIRKFSDSQVQLPHHLRACAWWHLRLRRRTPAS